MNARGWRKSALMLTVALAAFAPGIGRAATTPTVNSLVLYGDMRPAFDTNTGARVDPNPRTAWDDSQVIFPNSLPDGASSGSPSTTDMDRVHFYGNALSADGTAPASVTVSVTDGVTTFTAKTTPAAQDDSGIGVHKGDFSGSIQVTELGVHSVDMDPSTGLPIDDPTKFPSAAADQLTYLSHLGATTLSVSAFASDATGDGAAYVDSTGVAPTITKYAGSPFDRSPLSSNGLSKVSFPPAGWCHNPGAFRGQLFLVFTSPSAQAPVVPCAGQDYRYTIEGPPPQTGGFCTFGARFSVVQFDTCHGISAYGATGEAPISGVANDDISTAFAQASEIQDIKIQILQGASANGATLLAQPNSEIHSIYRVGPTAIWGHNQRINDLAPNWPEATPSQGCTQNCYFFKVIITDAWGNTVTTMSKATTVYPF